MAEIEALVFKNTAEAHGALMSIGFCPAGTGPKMLIVPYGEMENYPTTDKGLIPIGHLYEGGSVLFDANSDFRPLDPFRELIREKHRAVTRGQG